MKAPVTSRQGAALMVLTAFLWSSGGLLIKVIPWNPVVISGLRSAVSAVLIYLYLRLGGCRLLLNRRVLLPALALAMTLDFFVVANKLTTSANAIVLQSTSPVWVLLLGVVLFRQRLSLLDGITVLCTAGGISLFFVEQLSAGGLLGNLIGLASGVWFGLFFLTNGRLPDEDHVMSALFWAQIIAAATGVPFLFTDPPVLSPASVGALIVLGVFQLGLPYITYGIASRACPPLTCSLLSLIEPLLNPVWVFLAVGERPGTLALVGAAIVIVSITTRSVIRSRRSPA